MTVRFCTTCHADVEDTGGFCLLGHSLRVAPAMESMDELRADVDQAFAAARAELAAISGRAARAPEPPARIAPGPPPISSAPVVPAPAPAAPAAAAALDEAAPVPSAAAAQPVPPPPSPQIFFGTVPSTVWTDFGDELESAEAPAASDPISMFAPSPRMDWGPERATILRRPARIRRTSSASA